MVRDGQTFAYARFMSLHKVPQTPPLLKQTSVVASDTSTLPVKTQVLDVLSERHNLISKELPGALPGLSCLLTAVVMFLHANVKETASYVVGNLRLGQFHHLSHVHSRYADDLAGNLVRLVHE